MSLVNSPTQQPATLRPALLKHWVFAGPLLIFLALHLVLNCTISVSFNADSADQLIFSQSLALGYHEQPPLYSWLAWLFFRSLGVNFVSFSLLQSSVLASLYTAMFLCAKLILVDQRRALLTAFSPFLIPTFAWHSISYLTHTNLVCAFCAITLYVYLQLHRNGRWIHYALLGLSMGLGTLSKYNYVLFVTALLGAGLTLGSFRVRLLQWRMLLTLGIFLAVVVPHGLWLARHWGIFTALACAQTEISQWEWSLRGMAGGVGNLVTNIFAILTPLWVLFVWLFPEGFRTGDRPADVAAEVRQMLGRFFLAAIGLGLLLVAAGATRFHERWLQPFTLMVPLYFFSRLRYVTLPEIRLRRYGYSLLGCAALITVARGAQFFAGEHDDGIYPRQMCFAEAASELGAAGGRGAIIVATDREISGNMRYWLPQARHLCAGHPLYVPASSEANDKCILIWNSLQGNDPPTNLRKFVAETLYVEVPVSAPVHFVNIPPELPGRRANRLAYVVLSTRSNAASDRRREARQYRLIDRRHDALH